MIALEEDYLAHVMELRDAGKQLMHLFDVTGRQAENPSEKHKIRRQFLEAELYVLQLEELIGKMDPGQVPPQRVRRPTSTL